jgi:hypothetical protein
VVVAAGHDEVAPAGGGVVADREVEGWVDLAVADQVVADPAGQFPGLLAGAGEEQDVPSGQVVGGERAAGQVGCFLGVAVAEPAVLVVAGQDGDVAGPEPEGGVAFPAGGEPDWFGELGRSRAGGRAWSSRRRLRRR